MTMENQIILQVKDLKVSFLTDEGKVQVINEINFTLEKGKILGIVGESGCGKSALALSIMGLLAKGQGFVDGGEIKLGDKALLQLGEQELEKIRGNEMAMIFQEPMTSLNPVMTIGDQIGEALRIHKGLKGRANKEKVIELLNDVHIPEPIRVMKEYPHLLSGGMRQRVMIAMALSCVPQLLIADEPTTALDVTIQAQILELIKELNKVYETSMMLITHDLGVIAEMADEVLVLYAGRVVERTTVEELFDNPKHPYTKGLLASRPSNGTIHKNLHSIKGTVPSLKEMPKGCAFHPRCDYCMERCKEEQPDWSQLTKEHGVRCFLYEGGMKDE